MQTLYTLLEGSLHAPWNAERLRVYGRLTSPLAVVGLIAPEFSRSIYRSRLGQEHRWIWAHPNIRGAS